jgi:hypothetical protein
MEEAAAEPSRSSRAQIQPSPVASASARTEPVPVRKPVGRRTTVPSFLELGCGAVVDDRSALRTPMAAFKS